MKLKGREVDKYGRVTFTEDGVASLMKGGDMPVVTIRDQDWYRKYLEVCDQRLTNPVNLKIAEDLSCSVREFDTERQQRWFMPESYRTLDLETYLAGKCRTDAEAIRVAEELALYESRNLADMLRFLIYLVDTFRENSIVWGVGRGSSVASYILYLIGVHKINSLKFGLDVSEFLR